MNISIFSDFLRSVDKTIERKKFNPNITPQEYAAMSEAEQADWQKQFGESLQKKYLPDEDREFVGTMRRYEWGE
ncbi:MAG TPA: hypothetical protein VFX37_09835 [Pseudolabrys sp.]|nr:hypothetical protein [Pseudolabrys sp.]